MFRRNAAAVAPAPQGSSPSHRPLIFGSKPNKLTLYKVTFDDNLEVSIIKIQNSQGDNHCAICIFNKKTISFYSSPEQYRHY